MASGNLKMIQKKVWLALSVVLLSFLQGGPAFGALRIDRVLGTGDGIAAVAGGEVLRVSHAASNIYGDTALVAVLEEGPGGVTSSNNEVVLLRSHGSAWEMKAREGGATTPFFYQTLLSDGTHSAFGDVLVGDNGDLAFRSTVIRATEERDVVWLSSPSGDFHAAAGTELFARVRYDLDGEQTHFDELNIRARHFRISEPTFSNGALTFSGDVIGSDYNGRQGIWFHRPSPYGWWLPTTSRPPSFVQLNEEASIGLSGVSFRLIDAPIVVEDGSCVFGAQGTDTVSEIKVDGIWRKADFEDAQSATTLLLASGQLAPSAPGDVFDELTSIDVSTQGDVVVRGALRGLTLGTAPTVSEGVWRLSGGSWQKLLLSGESRPSGAAGEVLSAFRKPVVSEAGHVAMVARSETGAGDDAGLDLLLIDSSGIAVSLATSGGALPGVASGEVVRTFGDPEVNRFGEVLLVAEVFVSAEGEGVEGRYGCWFVDRTGTISRVALEGAAFEVAPSDNRVVEAFEIHQFKDNGTALVSLDFTDGSGGLFEVSDLDETPPSMPGPLVVSTEDSNRGSLEWAESTDDTSIRAYVVCRNGVEIARVRKPSYTDVSVGAGVGYTYSVSAVDHAGNESSQAVSSLVEFPAGGFELVMEETEADYVGAPHWGLSFDVNASAGESRLLRDNSTATWTPDLPASARYAIYAWISADPNSGVGETRDLEADYLIYDGLTESSVIVDQFSSVGGWAYVDTAWLPVGTSSFVRLSRESNSTAGDTLADAIRFVLLEEDTTSPDSPAIEFLDWVSSSEVEFRWAEVSDSSGVVIYSVYRDGALVGTTTELLWRDTNLTPGASHSYSVVASDYFGNDSAQGATFNVALPVPIIDVVVDEVEATFNGPGFWGPTTDVDSYDGSSRNLVPDSSATYRPSIPVTGTYEVQVWVSAEQADGSFAGRPSAVSYEVVHSEGTEVAVFDQSQSFGTWVWMGTYDFNVGTSGSVTPMAASTGLRPCADAIRFVLLEGDSEAPSVPAGLSAEVETSTRVRLTWDPAASASATVTYRIYRNLEYIGETDLEEFVDTTVVSDIAYGYQVYAVDILGNESAPSPMIVASLPQLGPEVIVDETEATFNGPGFWGPTNHLDTYGAQSRNMIPGSTANWRPTLPGSGQYEVFVWVSVLEGDGDIYIRPTTTRYDVQHANGTSVVILDQNTNPGDWTSLGAFEFDPSLSQPDVMLTGPSGRRACADAIRFTKLVTASEMELSGGAALPGTATAMTVTVPGADFVNGAGVNAVRLVSGAQTVNAALVSTVAGEELSFTFDVPSGVSPSLWDIEIELNSGEVFGKSEAILVGDPEGDDDSDGTSNLLELAMGTDPTVSTSRFVPEMIVEEEGEGLSMKLKFRHPIVGEGIPGVDFKTPNGFRFEAEVSSALLSWQAGETHLTSTSEIIGGEVQEVTVERIDSSEPFGFARLRVSLE